MKQFLRELHTSTGRLNRKKFWLGIIAIIVMYAIVAAITMTLVFLEDDLLMSSSCLGFSQLDICSLLGIIWPILFSLGLFYVLYLRTVLSIKRLHDLDKSGWWVLLSLVPIANIYIFIITGFIKGTRGINPYGPDPLRELDPLDSR